MVREEDGFLTIPDFGLRASFTRRYDARILSARTHSCTLKHLKQFFPRHSTQTLTQRTYLYPNPNQTEIWEEYQDKFKCPEAKCRVNPGKVRASTYGTKSPSRSGALRFIDSAKSPENPTCANHVDVLTVRSVFFECPLSTSFVVSRVYWKACA